MKNVNHNYPFELKPSSIDGIGLFSRIEIKKGTDLSHYLVSDAIFVKNIPDKKMRDKFCIKTKKGWWCPPDFGRMSMWWYVNHSDRPNVTCKRDSYKALKNLKPGDEITTDYNEFNNCDNLSFRFGINKNS
jgi:SET domain-containing protein